MNKEETVIMIAERIKSEHRKHKEIEWERIAAYKIYASLNKIFNLHDVSVSFCHCTDEQDGIMSKNGIWWCKNCGEYMVIMA